MNIAQILIYVLVVALAFWGLYYIVTSFVPEPLKKPAMAILVILGLIILIYFLLQFAGGAPSFGHSPVRPIR
jgi:hypothetical protein